MLETFAALLLAHAAADFALQSRALALAKHGRDPWALLLHALIVAATTCLTLGPVTAATAALLLGLALLHALIDLAKSFAPETLGAFLADQAAHLVSLLALAIWMPGLYAQGFWGQFDWLPAVMILMAGLLIATRAGGVAVGLLMRPWADTELPRGLTNGGFLIGMLERGLIFLFVLVGQPMAIAFLIAAKSLLRFDTAKADIRAGEYVIIGTLASFGWALVASYGTLWITTALPHLGIPLATP